MKVYFPKNTEEIEIELPEQSEYATIIAGLAIGIAVILLFVYPSIGSNFYAFFAFMFWNRTLVMNGRKMWYYEVAKKILDVKIKELNSEIKEVIVSGTKKEVNEKVISKK